MHKRWAIRCTIRYNKPPMDKTLERGAATIYKNVETLLQRSSKGTATKNEYTKDHGLICASNYRSNIDMSTIQPPMKNPQRVFSNTPYTRWESKP